MMKCPLSWCNAPLNYDNLCLPHTYLLDWWGRSVGYTIYIEQGKRAGRKAFEKFLLEQGQDGCLGILARMATNDYSPENISREKIIAFEKYGELVKAEARNHK